MAVNQVNVTDFSSVDLRCSRCENYLSIPPIYVHTDQDGKIKNICGRCNVREDGKSIRNASFEALAKFMKFPCSISEDCKEKVSWGKTEQHEANCRYREMICGICSLRLSKAHLVNHFSEKHKKELFNKTNLSACYRHIFIKEFSRTYLVVCPKITCLVHMNWDLYNATITVEPLFLTSIQHYFSVTFTSIDCVYCFKNLLIENGKALAWKKQPFKVNLEKFLDFKMELKIHMEKRSDNLVHQKPENANRKSAISPVIEENLTDMQQLSSALECSTCFKVMKSHIFVCKKGHSICEQCQNMFVASPLCQDELEGTRNFALEEISRKFAEYL